MITIKNILRLGWPLILSIILFLVIFQNTGSNQDFLITLVATLIGVFLAFWLNYLFVLFNERRDRRSKLRRLMLLLRNELASNQDDIDWFKRAITSAMTENVLNNPDCTKSISALLENLRDRSFYSIQAAGWFDSFDNEKLFSDVSSIYLGINRLKGITRFAQAGHEKKLENKDDREAQSIQYKAICITCDVVTNEIKKAVSELDESILKIKTIKSKSVT
jgi:hypothetical protein